MDSPSFMLIVRSTKTDTSSLYKLQALNMEIAREKAHKLLVERDLTKALEAKEILCGIFKMTEFEGFDLTDLAYHNELTALNTKYNRPRGIK